MRRITVAIVVAFMALGLTALITPAAVAGNCHGKICGGMINKTGRIMSIAQLGSGDDRCKVWNEHDIPVESNRTYSCDQDELSTGLRKGGNGTGVDMDAFTFDSERYRVQFFSTHTAWTEHKEGVWTKIPDGFVAVCARTEHDRLECTVRLFLPNDTFVPESPASSAAAPVPSVPQTSSGRLKPAPSEALEPAPSARLEPAPSARLEPAPSARLEPAPPEPAPSVLSTSGVRNWILENIFPLALLTVALLLLWLGGGRGDNAGVMRRLGGVIVALVVIGLALTGGGVDVGTWLVTLFSG